MGMIDSRAVIAAANNADWYQMMFDVRGLRYERSDLAFVAVDRPPPLHSWMVTLTPEANSELGQLVDANRHHDRFGVKDAFQLLDSHRFGLVELFAAQWIWADGVPTTTATEGWGRVTAPGDLERWEEAWATEEPPLPQRQFPESVLDRPDVAVFGHRAGAGYDAGAVANRSSDCVGISNAFGPVGSFHAAAALCAGFGDSVPVVGYERGDSLTEALAAGFEAVGPLRVLVKG